MSSQGARKAALVIGPAFFGYEHDIVAELESQGYVARFLDERPSNNAIVKAIVRARPALMGSGIRRHFERMMTEIARESIDLVLVLKGEVVPRWFLEDLRRRNPRARFVLYTYDALANASNCLVLADLFDERLSFDRDDVAVYEAFEYLPLFYTEDFDVSRRTPDERPWSVAFVGTLHSDRYRFVATITAGLTNAFTFFFVQARWYFAVIKYLTGEHRSVPWGAVSFKPMSKTEVARIFGRSRAVLDLQREGQVGLTMRTFEVLASGAILVTTNSAVARESFYDTARVLIVAEQPSPTVAREVQRKLAAMAVPSSLPDGFEQYALRSWVERVRGSHDGDALDSARRSGEHE